MTNPAPTPRLPRGEHMEELPVGSRLLGHGMVTGVRWPFGTCLTCGCIVNAETGDGHDAARHAVAP